MRTVTNDALNRMPGHVGTVILIAISDDPDRVRSGRIPYHLVAYSRPHSTDSEVDVKRVLEDAAILFEDPKVVSKRGRTKSRKKNPSK